LPATWNFLLTDNAGVNLAELSTGAGRTLTFARNATPEAHVTISHDDVAAAMLFTALRNGIPKLRAYRNGTLRFHGDLAPFDEQLEEGAQLNLVFRGPFSRLIGYGQSRGRFTAASFTRTATDAGQIAKALIDTYGTGAGVATTGTITASKTRDRAYQYANVGEAIVNLTRVLDGFDFEVLPTEYSAGNIGQLVVYAAQGSDRTSTVRFQYGPGTLANCRSVNRQTEPPINTARVIGANGLVGLKTDAGSIATYGEMWVQESASDVSEQTTLDDKAQALLRPDPIKVVSFTPEPDLAPSPWDDYWLGDTVSFFGRRGAFYEDATMRVDKITVVIDDDGNEAVEVERPGTLEAAGTDGGEVVTAAVEGEVIDETPAPVDVSDA
jgi:hypothetical protein